MIHWTNKYIGIPYNRRTMNCVTLVEKVYEQELGRKLDIPHIEKFGVEDLNKSLGDHMPDFCEEIVDRDPVDFDILLMSSMGHYNHVGVAVWVNRRLCVLHSFAGARQVAITPMAELSKYHLTPVGFYKCR